MPHSSSWGPNRRQLLQVLGAASGGTALASLGAAQEDEQAGLVAEQADQCIPITPLGGSEPVEALYDYAYPQDRFHGPPGSDGTSFSSEGTTDLQRDRTSLLFLYEGPDGLSLVVVHGHLDGETDAGGTITFGFHGLPADGQWIVRDDYYVDASGRKPESNHDRWDVGGDVHTVDWAYKGGRTDGGAFRGLGTDLHVRIEPAFNDAAALAADHGFGPLESWELLTGSRASPERHSLVLDRPLVIRRGECPGGGSGTGGDGGSTGDGDSTTDGDETTGEEPTEDGEPTRGDDRDETKHERKQRKHETKHERKQRKHEQKHERKQRKHEEKEEREEAKHERKQRKHEEKEEREEAKHERKQRKHEREDDDDDDDDDD